MTQANNHIVIITSGQPSLNPRLVKEADALVVAGYQVTVLYQFWNSWGTEMDKTLLSKKKWEAIRVGGSPSSQKLIYWYSRLNQKKDQFLFKYFPNILTDFGLSRCTKLLLKEAVKHHAALYIAHNLGALPAAINAAKKNSAKCGFDAEDFHRQEVTDDVSAKQYQLVKLIEDKYLPKIDYLTCASPLIEDAYKKLYPNLTRCVINNVFPSSLLKEVTLPSEDKQLKLFWFSQTIGKGRGIEEALTAISMLNKKHITLTLLGNLDEPNRYYFNGISKNLGLADEQLELISPIHPNAIFEFANQYDIGLALERNSPLNRNICLTNKVFTYLTAGLAIIASETLAQKEFLQQNLEVGKCYPVGNIDALAKAINNYDNDRILLHKTKIASSRLARETMNWEIESKKFLAVIEETLQC